MSAHIDSQSSEGTADSEGAGATASGRLRAALPRWAPVALAVALGAWAFRGLIGFRPRTSMAVSLSNDVEQWFFQPADTSPILVLLIALWLGWRRWPRVRAQPREAGPLVWTLLGLGAALGIFFWAVRTGAYDLMAVSLALGLLGGANWMRGPGASRALLVPALVLFFAMPMPAPLLNHVVWQCQIWTAEYTGFLLYLLGQPGLISGDQIIRSDHIFVIIETCSGLRSIETLTLLAVLMSDLFRRRGLHAALLLLAAPPVAFTINGFRCLGLIFNPHSDIAAIHSAQGVAMLLGGVLLLYGLDGLLGRLLPSGTYPPPRRRSGEAAHTAASGRVWALAGVTAVFAAVSLWVPRFSLDAMLPNTVSETIPREFGSWDSSERDIDWLFLGKAGFGQALQRRYRSGPEAVEVFVATGGWTRRFRSALSPKTALPGSGWIIEDEGFTDWGGRPVRLRVVRRGTERLLVAHWYQGTGGLADETVRALLAYDSSPLRRTRVPVVVRLQVRIAGGDSRAAAEEILRRFAVQLDAPLQKLVTPRGI